MAFTELEAARHERALKKFYERRRPPPAVRPELDILCRFEGQSALIVEIRPYWLDRTQKIETVAAKATFVRKTGEWKVYWMRKDMKWHRYETERKVTTFEQFLGIVEEDRYGCFFG